jgi:glycine/D-amino acid oxidase-like deaminating enzyme
MSKPTSLSRVGDCVVIGGGIAGCTIAYELARRGLGVTVFEQNWLASAASGRNMGLLVNQVDPRALRMMRTAIEVYREVEALAPLALRRSPQLLLARDPAQLTLAQQHAQALREASLEADLLDVRRLRRDWPALAPDIAGGVLVTESWLLDPAAATHAFAEAAREAGARIETGTRVASILPNGVLTDRGRVAADVVVAAAGPWLSDLLPGAPINAGRGWLLRTARLPTPIPWVVEEMSWPSQDQLGRLARPLTLEELASATRNEPAVSALAIAPLPSGEALIGTSLTPSLRDAVEGLHMPQLIAQRALHCLPGLGQVPVVAAWSGLRPMTPDGRPIVGRTLQGIWVHGGHGSIGMQAAPATARWLAEAIVTGEAKEELSELGPERFGA